MYPRWWTLMKDNVDAQNFDSYKISEQESKVCTTVEIGVGFRKVLAGVCVWTKN